MKTMKHHPFTNNINSSTRICLDHRIEKTRFCWVFFDSFVLFAGSLLPKKKTTTDQHFSSSLSFFLQNAFLFVRARLLEGPIASFTSARSNRQNKTEKVLFMFRFFPTLRKWIIFFHCLWIRRGTALSGMFRLVQPWAISGSNGNLFTFKFMVIFSCFFPFVPSDALNSKDVQLKCFETFCGSK